MKHPHLHFTCFHLLSLFKYFNLGNEDAPNNVHQGGLVRVCEQLQPLDLADQNGRLLPKRGGGLQGVSCRTLQKWAGEESSIVNGLYVVSLSVKFLFN